MPPPEKLNYDCISREWLDKYKNISYNSDVMNHYYGRKRAFTLAEVLITLGIIGVVAAMTIPTLIANYRVKQTVTQLKKINSTLQNTFTYTKLNDFAGANVKDWNINYTEFTNILAKNMKSSKVCGQSNIEDCFPNVNYKNLSGESNVLPLSSLQGGIVLNDGTLLGLIFNPNSSNANLTGDMGQIFVDINGIKAPNVLGRDVFSFMIRNDKLIARNTPTETDSPALGPQKYCSVSSGVGHNGLGCTAWVIYNENMDYLKCEGLNWHTKLHCD